ncbi:MAG: PIF1 family DEAD/DEAH box helicase [Patescibacteria group bacterium]
MTQAEALNILKTGANVFLTGEPGAGKSYTINSFVEYLRERDIEPAITASTGIAATHIGGMTIHSWSGIGIRKKLDQYDLDKIASSEYIARRVRRTRVLIIDEISMLTADMLDMIDAVCREVKQSSEPFGGMQIVLVGDFFQLPPIVKNDTDEKQKTLLVEKKKSVFAYDSNAWARAGLVMCYLTEQHRQDDKDFLDFLSAIRADKINDEHMEYVTARQTILDDVPDNVTKLFTHNFNVDTVNNMELEKITEEKRKFEMISEGRDALVMALKKGCLSPENLELKIGAVVMCTKNNQKEGYVNGTLGIVEDFDEFTGYPIIKKRNGKSINVSPLDWVVEENGKILAMISQVPLRLAWAMTVHKSQGMSLDAAIMDLSQVFEYGQGYVALSRVRRLSGLYLLGINERAFKVHPEILEKDIFFKEQSAEAVKVFGKLSESELQKMHDNFVLASGGEVKIEYKREEQMRAPSTARALDNSESSPVKPFEKIREQHPNAYRPWDKIQDEELEKLFSEGVPTADLMKKFGRKKGGITARLEKLGLVKS